MGRFHAQVTALQTYLAQGLAQGRIRRLAPTGTTPWPADRSFVLARDTALDLGSPAVGSVGFLIWTPAPADTAAAAAASDRVLLEGPDVAELADPAALAARAARTDPSGHTAAPLPFGQVILVHGSPPDDYEGYLALKEAQYDLALEGLALRSMPSQSHLWCRVHADAVARGFSLAHLGAALATRLRQLPFVSHVDVLFHTAGRDSLAPLAALAASAARVVGALVKRHEEEHAACDDCEYQDICDEREREQEHRRSAP